MTEPLYEFTDDGQEQEQADIELTATEAAHASGYTLAELLRLAPWSGSMTGVTKAIIPYAIAGANGAMVQPNGGSGSILLMPFTVVVGSRVGVGATSTDVVDTTGPILNWRDIRSGIYCVSDNGTSLGHAVAFTANSSGNPRWDLVYAAIQCEQVGSQIQRFVQAAGQPLPTVTTSVNPPTAQIVTVGVQPGTAASTPSQPGPPADTNGQAGTFYVPLAYVLIPNGFSGTSAITTQQIQTVAPIPSISTQALSSYSAAPANSFSSATAIWSGWGASGTRTPSALPSTMVGCVERFFGFDATTSSPVFGDAIVIDNSIDWRNRIIRVEAFVNAGASQFQWQHGATSTAMPSPTSTGSTLVQRSATFVDNSSAILGTARTASVIFYANNAIWSQGVASGTNSIGLYVTQSDGALRVYYQGTPGQLILFSVRAYGAFDNY